MQSHNPLPLWFHPNQYEKSRKPRIQRLPWHVRAPACGIPNLLAISKIFMIDLYKWKRLLEVAKPKGNFPKFPHWGSRPTSHKTLPYCPSLQMLFGFVKAQPMCIHLQFQNLFANLAGYWRTVPLGLIAFSPITPSISATTCGSGGKLVSVRLLIDEPTHVVRNQASGNRYNLRSLSSCSGCSAGSWWLHWFCCIKSREFNPLNPISGLDHW